MTFLEVLSYSRIAFHRSASEPAEVRLCCPFCSDTRFRLGVNVNKGLGHCYNCDWRSRTSTLEKVLKQLGVVAKPVAEVSAALQDRQPTVVRLPADFQRLAVVHKDDAFAKRARRYLMARGVTGEQIERNGIGFSMVGRYAYRVVFPVRDRGELKGLVARDFTGVSSVRYLNSLGDKWLYNTPGHCAKTVVLSEGVFKALRLETALGVTSMALLGHSITENQLRQLQALRTKRVVLWPDPDRPGISGVLSVGRILLSEGFGVHVVYPLPALPADEASECDLQKCWESQQTLGWGLQNLLALEMAKISLAMA